MKKLLALVLVLCMVVGLVACTKKPAENPTGSTGPTVDPNNPYKGKTLQVWGAGGPNSYVDYGDDNVKFHDSPNYLWMIRAAIEEWGAINGVTVEFSGWYDQNRLLAAMNSGSKPDIVMETGKFPIVANYGIAAPLTDAEYNALVDISGNKQYMDMLSFRGKSYGYVYPWTGNFMLYFNKSMFERYNVKSPLDYFNEGTWTWDAFETCLKEMTKDTNADGKMDTYGINGDSWGALLDPSKMDPTTGKVVSTIDEPWILDYFELKYNAFTVNKTVTEGGSKIQTKVTNPKWAMQISDCEIYNYDHMFEYLEDGDEIMVVPVPKWTGDNGESKEWLKFTQAAAYLAASCDEREAAFDLLCYLMKCGMKYMSDYSFGAIKCDYPGIQGACEVSQKWKNAFAELMEIREQDRDEERPHYDAAHMTKIYDYVQKMDGWNAYAAFGGITSLLTYPEITKNPPATAIETVRAKYQAALDTYNEKYVFD